VSCIEILRMKFGDRLHEQEALSRYTSARVGGAAEALLVVESAEELASTAEFLWQREIPFIVLGGGSNVLVSDDGVREVVLVNKARSVRFDEAGDPPTVWAESGANFGLIARQAAGRGLAGLEWAAGIPGTLGGAVFGNAGAHSRDMAGNLILAEILHHKQAAEYNRHFEPVKEQWSTKDLAFEYRSSVLRRTEQTGISPEFLILAALLRLERSTPETVQSRIDEYTEFRHRTQPPGASMGSMFKNPPGDYAGRLIEAADLKGTTVGDATISSLHGNFFINRGQATARDIFNLIRLARRTVAEKFGVRLELEIELVGEWKDDGIDA
jgi:UDP-N-acetylmuramate dehydrogenase